ncbi:putative acyltransferase [Halobacteriovorax marinus SJ]|uniref:Acyltransferase n=1 Tax=Halobacteriovorax marinus (strain ATCC BAA-682 / DSM 15412 / SJ) TaxID=862908 RepID=E1X229_HALMS|nr:C45 family peptidase [Halobacteriovorax marinus]CBW26689.1 putative acyltransferase [Halobacteriovorax marinus SJ]
MQDCNFPIIRYEEGKSNFEWGIQHAEEHRTAIRELVEIRRELMLKRNPSLAGELLPLASAQFESTLKYCPNSANEIEGIAKGSGLSLTDIVILNNYTDFRDISLVDQGCSTVQIQNSHSILSGQTWDMHASAKNYLCLIDVPATEENSASLILSVVGCVGLMGINTQSCLIGVNNINTNKAAVGLIWPALVRQSLESVNISQMRDTLLNAPVTSGHNYLISTPKGAEHWEITPTHKDLIHAHGDGEEGYSFHTNHCLGENVSKLESKEFVSATTHARYEILEQSVKNTHSMQELKQLLQSHEGMPKSICSHYDNGNSKDPSQTCGGGIANLISGEINFWRGCPEYDPSYKEYSYKLDSENKSFSLLKN